MPRRAMTFRLRDDDDQPIEFVFRIPDIEDLTLLEGTVPLLPVDEEALKDKPDEEVIEVLQRDPERMARLAKRCDFLLSRCALRPRLVDDPDAFFNEDGTLRALSGNGAAAPTAFPLRALTGRERLRMGFALFAQAGYTEEATVELIPLSGTVDSLNGSIKSGSDTGDSPTKFSTSDSAGKA